MIKGFKQALYGLIAVLAVSVALFAVPSVGAADPLSSACAADPSATVCTTPTNDFNAVVAIIVNTLLFLIGAISVLMVIVGAFMYTTSGGDSAQLTKAKNTILYSIVGLVVAALAYAIVTYVVSVL